MHHCNVVKIIGESYRLKESKALFKKNELIKCTKSWSIYVHFISVINNGEYSRTMEVVTIFTSYAIIAIIFLIIALSFYKFILVLFIWFKFNKIGKNLARYYL